MKNLTLAIFLSLPMAAQAQGDLLPDYAYDALADLSAITTAGQTCDGAKVNDGRLQKAMVALMGKLAADGLDPVASVQSLTSETGVAQLAVRETELRARHGVAPEGGEALCDAIRAEVKTNKAMAKILKLR
ncbi:MAG: hypothetical protein V3U96_10050 [Paracoccaceae bacterium]